MTNFVLKHFKNEEEYMKNFSYTHFEEHKNKHDGYSFEVAKYNAELLGNNPPDPIGVLSYIEEWWQSHILENDAHYEEYKMKVGAKVVYVNLGN